MARLIFVFLAHLVAGMRPVWKIANLGHSNPQKDRIQWDMWEKLHSIYLGNYSNGNFRCLLFYSIVAIYSNYVGKYSMQEIAI